MKVSEILENYMPGDADPDSPDRWTWTNEFAQLWDLEHEYMSQLVADISQRGIVQPVLLGDDGRFWDGHHRLAVAVALLIPDIEAWPANDPRWEKIGAYRY